MGDDVDRAFLCANAYRISVPYRYTASSYRTQHAIYVVLAQRFCLPPCLPSTSAPSFWQAKYGGGSRNGSVLAPLVSTMLDEARQSRSVFDCTAQLGNLGRASGTACRTLCGSSATYLVAKAD